jgi:hypothetical protein
LRAAGVERLFMACASGGCWGRPELHRLLDQRVVPVSLRDM